MIDAATLVPLLQRLPARNYEGTGYRFSSLYPLKHNINSLSGEGALWGKGRFHDGGSKKIGRVISSTGSYRMCYVALHPDAALLEVEVVTMARGIRVAIPFEPKAFWSVDYDLRQVMDLTDDLTLSQLGLTPQELYGPWKLGDPSTQLLGRLAFDSGRFDAIRYRSAKDSDYVNFAVFTEILNRTSGSLSINLRAPHNGPKTLVTRYPEY